jgi:dTDP-4-dehydrorhamnose 3,5-epimerase
MKYTIEETNLPDVKIINPQPYRDDRGMFMEIYTKSMFEELKLPINITQINHSRSIKNVVRGLHYQWNPSSSKVMRVIEGEAFMVAVDIRFDSCTFKKWFGDYFSSMTLQMLYIPEGFATGFCSLSQLTEIEYLMTGEYNPQCQGSILWNDPDIGIKWPIETPILSERDKDAWLLKDWIKSKFG